MPSTAVVLVVASFLAIILIYSSVANFDVFALHKKSYPQCSQLDIKSTTLTATRCCWSEWDQFSSTSPEENWHSYCQDCYYNISNGKFITCDPVKTIVRTSGQTGILGTTSNPTNALPPPGSNSSTLPPVSIIKLPGTTNAGPPGNNTSSGPSGKIGIVSPVTNATNAVPPGNTGQPPTPPPPTNALPPSGTNTGTPPPVTIIKVPPRTTNPTGTATNPGNGPSTSAAESTGGGGETVNCLPGQEANSNLGVCVDPVCAPGTQRDPTGQTRYCVAITCPPGETFNQDINQCLPVKNPPPNIKCPDGSQGTLEQTSSGISVVVCPNSLPPTPPPPPGSIIKAPPGAINAPPTGNNTGTPPLKGTILPLNPTANAPPTTNSSSGNTIARATGPYSPTGYCVRTDRNTCLPCDPGLPGGQDRCIPTSEWPPPLSFPFRNSSGLATATSAGNAQPTGSNPGTSPPPSLLAQQPSTGHHHHEGGQTSTSSSTTNSTGH